MHIKDITPTNVQAYIQGNVLAALEKNNPTSNTEQATYRAYKCLPCAKNGSCLHCGCKTPALFYAPNRQCSQNRWGSFLDDKNWSLFKRGAQYLKDILTPEYAEAYSIIRKNKKDVS